MEFTKANMQVAGHWLRDRFRSGANVPLTELKPGEAAIITLDGDKVAAYRDDEGVVHAVSAVCTHMGCDVAWNNAERTWDCACHGSRFDHDGRVLHGPAVKDLEPKRDAVTPITSKNP